MTKEKVLKIVKENKWSIQAFNGYPLYLWSVANYSAWEVEKKLGVGYRHLFYFFSGQHASMYYDEADWLAISESYYDKYNISGLEELMSIFWKDLKKAEESSKYDQEKLSSLTISDLALLGYNLCEAATKTVSFSHIIEALAFGSEIKLREFISKKGKMTETDLGILCSPVVPSFIYEAQAELWKIKNNSGQMRDELIVDYLKNFYWVENSYLGAKDLTTRDVITRANAMEKEPNNDFGDNAIAKNELITNLGFDDSEKFIVETIEKCFAWQDERKKGVLIYIAKLNPVMLEIASRIGVNHDILAYILPKEMTAENLQSSNFINELKDRSQGCVVYADPVGYKVFSGYDYVFFKEELDISFQEKIEKITGTIGSPGKVIGQVRICQSISDIEKIKSGEILVASMTRPEYLTAMQRASAFVTDEGGITCHAAIVAREMKKPCIIGTRVATKVLQDGDMVEVDADNGIITKL